MSDDDVKALNDDVNQPQVTGLDELDEKDESSVIHDPQVTPPARADEQAFGGSNPALTSDDDIDEVGEEYGVEYSDDEELDVSKKVKITSDLEPPEKSE